MGRFFRLGSLEIRKKFRVFYYNILRENGWPSNMLYFLCKSAGKWWKSGKNMFDFMEKWGYNVSTSLFFA
ncbi:hypothetical protein B5E84_10670 [Lachnoclostridium sp. An14]|nr:hypothetical protein B5E84_10670 [Lachnoclostridium sp. An14]